MDIRFIEIPASELEAVSVSARRAGLSANYLYRLIRERKLKAYEVGGKLLLHKPDVDSLIEKRRAS
jgi:excisionase family DNA binding protein